MHVQKVELKDLQRHGVVADTLKTVIEAQLRRMKKDTREVGWTLTRIKHWAEQIEILNPSIDRGGREPANCEYPWADEQGKVHSPLDHSFGALNFRKEPASATFLTLLGEAISYYAKM